MANEYPMQPMRVSWGVLCAFTLAALPMALIQMPISVYLPAYYATHTHLGLGVLGAVFSLTPLAAIGVEISIGVAVVRTRTRFGRYRPWLIVGALTVAVAGYAAFFPSPHASAWWLAVVQTALLVGYSTNLVILNAWGTVVAPDYDERSRLYAWQQFMIVAVTVLTLVLGIVLARRYPDDGQQPIVHAVGWALVVLAPLSAVWATLRIGERVEEKVVDAKIPWAVYRALLSTPNFVRVVVAGACTSAAPSVAGVVYFFFITRSRGFSEEQGGLLLLVYMICGLAGALACGRLAQKFGKHRTLASMAVVNVATQLAFLLVPKASMLVGLPVVALAGIVANSFPNLTSSMVADVADEIEYATGEDQTAVIYSLMSSAMKIGAAVSIGMVLPVLDLIGFNPELHAQNTSKAIHGLEACYVGGPVVLLLIAVVALRNYRLDAKQHAQLRRLLASRRAGALAPALGAAE